MLYLWVGDYLSRSIFKEKQTFLSQAGKEVYETLLFV